MRRLVLLLFLVPPVVQAQSAAIPWAPLDDAETAWIEPQCLHHLATAVCRSPNDPGPGFTFEIAVNHEPALDWTSNGWAHTGFRVFALDRDEEGLSPEHLIVANNDAVSNGMGVSYWTLTVLEEPGDAPRLGAVVPVEEFGPDGQSFDTSGGDLLLWATEWLSGPDPSGQRGDGLYFVGRPFRIQDGLLVPATDRPLRARRFLDRFAEARASGPADPVGWLHDDRAETRDADPFLGADELIAIEGRVTAVEAFPADYGRTAWAITLSTPDGGTATLTYADGWDGVSEPPFTHFGEAASGRLYPPGYRPFALSDWLAGRTIRAVTYASDAEARRVLWVE